MRKVAFLLIGLFAAGAFCLFAAQAPAPDAATGGAVTGRGRGGGAQGRGAPAFPERPPTDPALVAHGEQLFGVNCSFCHGSDARGGEGGPNLLRDQLVMDDRNGELITTVVQNGISDKGMPKFATLSPSDIVAIAAFVHSLGLGRGGPPVPVNPVVGDAAAGKAFFEGPGKCATCHSSTGDLARVGGKYDPRTLQGKFLMPNGGRGAAPANIPPTTVTVTPPNGQKVEGTLVAIDEFSVTLKTADGSERSFTLNGDVPKVEVHDPLQAHKDLLPKYTDVQIHNLTAYLVTLK
ncbi:MAG TPA: c-type cytochrome [Candidatus Acidoferrales bacterium]|nr:c-type cytochrome [Candidatus Acidoferrales bacterium]